MLPLRLPGEVPGKPQSGKAKANALGDSCIGAVPSQLFGPCARPLRVPREVVLRPPLGWLSTTGAVSHLVVTTVCVSPDWTLYFVRVNNDFPYG